MFSEPLILQIGNVRFQTYIQSELSATRKGHRLISVLSGTAQIHANNKTFHLNKSDAIFLSPQIKYTGTLCADEQLFILDICLNKQAQTDDLYKLFSETLSDNTCLYLKKLTGLAQTAVQIMQTISSQQIGARYRLQTYLIQLLFLLADTVFLLHQASFSEKEPVALPKNTNMRTIFIDTYLHKNFRENITIHALAQKLSLSEKQVGRLVKKIYGRTFSQQLAYIRIHEAKQSLETSSLPVEEIAYAVGYSTYTGFYKVFKQLTGMSPKQYRKKN